MKLKRVGLKRAAGRAVVVLLVAGLFAGCGMQAKRPETKDSVNAEKEHTDKKELLSKLALRNSTDIYVTEHCIYEEKVQPCELVQSDWQGKEQHRYSLGEHSSIEWISDKYVCYTDNKGDEESVLYLAPIEKTEKGEKVKLEKKEKIADTEEDVDVYIWESNVYYCKNEDSLYYYDAAKKETKCLLKAGKNSTIKFSDMIYDDGGTRFVHNDKMYFIKSDYSTSRDASSLYCINQQTAKLDFLGEVKDPIGGILAVKDNLVFCSVYGEDLEGYIVYDTKEKKKKAQLEGKQIEAFLKRQGLLKEEGTQYQLLCRDGGEQLDFIVGISRMETGTKKLAVTVNQILLHCPWQELTALSIDKKFSQWMDEHLKYTKVFCSEDSTSSGNYYVSAPNIYVLDFYGEEILLCDMKLEKKDMKGKEVSSSDIQMDVDLKSFQWKAYDPDSGKVRDIPKSDALYQIIHVS